MKARTIFSIMFAFCIIGISSMADRGSIPFDPAAEIFEPNQRAIIAWSGTVEILLLSTDLKASVPTKVLEVIPLPSEPKVELGDIESFNRAVELINLNQSFRGKGIGRGGDSRGVESAEPAGQITFHEKLGAHDVSVAKVVDGAGFVKWVMDYLGSQGVEKAQVPEQLQKLISAYIAEGYSWFAFDVVELGLEHGSIKPLRYTFATDKLYYPLKISSLEKGHSQIDIIVITHMLLRNFPSLPIEQVRLMHDPFLVTIRDIAFIDEPMASIFYENNPNYMRIWRCEGDLSSFAAVDLIAN